MLVIFRIRFLITILEVLRVDFPRSGPRAVVGVGQVLLARVVTKQIDVSRDAAIDGPD